jgi:hypothetical protein
MDSPRRSARLAVKPRVDYTELDYADLNDYQRDTIHQMQHGSYVPSYSVEACAGLFSLAVVAFIVAFVASTSYHGTYSTGY